MTGTEGKAKPLLQPREPHDGRLPAMMVEGKKQPHNGLTRMGAGDGDGYCVERVPAVRHQQ